MGGKERRAQFGDLHDDIFLIQRVPVEELGEIDHRLVGIPSIIRMRAFGLTVLVLDGVQVVRGPVDGFTECARVLDYEVVSVSGI